MKLYIICAGITEKENFNKEFEKYNSKKKLKLHGRKMKSIGMEKQIR